MSEINNTTSHGFGHVPANGIAPIEQVDEDEFEAPDNIIQDAESARVIYDKMRRSHAKRSHTYAKIQGMIDGNPPFSKRTLARAGQHTQSNVNWRDGESIYESVALAYWSLFNDVEFVAEFETNIADPAANPVIGKIVAEEFDKVLRQWKSFYRLMALHQGDLIKFGTSFVTWPDERDWRFDVADVWRFLVPERTRNDIESINLCAIEHVMSAHELWNIFETYPRRQMGQRGSW